MTCASYEALIALYAEGDLPPQETQGVEAHLAACAGCRAFAADLAESQQAIHELAQEEIDPTVLAAVRHRVRAALPTPGATPRPAVSRATVWTLAAAAAAVVVLAVLLQWRDRTRLAPTTPAVAERPVAPPAGPSATPLVRESAPAPVTARASGVASRPAGTRRVVSRDVQEKPTPRAAKATESQSPLVIKLVTSDPDIVIYWLVEQNGGRS